MGFGDIFWVLFVLFAVWPMLQQRMLDAMRARKIAQLERIRGSRVILLVHRQETMRFLGIPLVRYIDLNDSEAVLRAIHLTDEDVPLDLVLHTPGGLVIAAMQIACAVRDHKSKVTVFVPHYAMSGGTLIALAADAIVMDSHAVLGPVDPQIGEFPAASLVKVVKEKDINEVDDKTLIFADQAAKALSQIRTETLELIGDKLPPEKAADLADKLSQGTWTHDHPIGFKEAAELGLPVSSDMPKDLYQLMSLFPQPVRRRPAVQYIPTPYGPPHSDERK